MHQDEAYWPDLPDKRHITVMVSIGIEMLPCVCIRRVTSVQQMALMFLYHRAVKGQCCLQWRTYSLIMLIGLEAIMHQCHLSDCSTFFKWLSFLYFHSRASLFSHSHDTKITSSFPHLVPTRLKSLSHSIISFSWMQQYVVMSIKLPYIRVLTASTFIR